MTGKILRFDEVRGYGFIAPDEGNEDVFMHANDLLEEKYLYQAGRHVEFFLEEGDKGPKASEIRLIRRSDPSGPSGPVPLAEPRPAPARRDDLDDDSTCDVLTPEELRAELTETLLAADHTLTAGQILHVRSRLVSLASDHGWVEPDDS
ncbi:cold shock domain-containing protein [Streptomyces sp. 6N223]|uniref:cold shock domain-containing protein n=1 Tax=Streptomyces sp. 6N223 TaxID=3457412 RepID=UPI003FCF69D3